MKSFNMLKMPVILLGFGGVLLLSPACKGQESTPDHFTDTGVQDVYEPVTVKAAAPTAKVKPTTVQARKRQTGSAATLQLAANRSSSLPAQTGVQAVAEKRKPTPNELKKP